MLSIRSIVLFCCFACVACAQATKNSNKSTPPPGVIHAVRVEGAKAYSAAAITNVLGLKIGSPATPEVFRDAQRKLLETDLFSNVAYSFKYSLSKPAQYDVTYNVSEYEQLYPLRFEGLGVPDNVVRDYLREHVVLYSDKIPPTQPVLRRYTEAAQDLVAQSKPNLRIKAFVSSDNPEHSEVVLGPDRPLPHIAGVTVAGNKAVDTPTLQRALNDVAVGQVLSDATVHAILNTTVKPLYAAKGYVAVSFPKIENEKSPDSEGYILHVQVQDGPQFHFGNSAFRGGAFTPEDIRPMMHYQKGQIFDVTKAEQLRRDLIDRLRHEGHLDVKIDLSQEEDDKNLAINLKYSIAMGPVYTFQTLDLHGLDIESEPAIRKLWAPKPGKPFNPEYPDFFLKRVREMGLFDNLGTTRSSYQPDEATHTVTVSLYFGGAEGESKKARQRGIPREQIPPQ